MAAKATQDEMMAKYTQDKEYKASASSVAAVARARDLSIQGRATEEDEGGGHMGNIFSYLVDAGELVPPWWSFRRDHELRRFWKSSDHLSGALFAVTGRISTINFNILPADSTIQRQVKLADEFQRSLLEDVEFGQGWNVFIGKWVEDLLVCDNGAFAEVIGRGRPDGPIIGRALSLAHLDSTRCTRTSDPEFPVIYFDDKTNRRYKLHYTRVIHGSQMPSPIVTMNGVGFSSISRAINIAQTLVDITRYKQEKMGSRPLRQMLVGSGLSTDEIWSALIMAQEGMDNRNLSRYAPTVVVANKNRDITLDQIDLASVPDGFDEETATTLGMYTIALAFGVDARELWPATASGATKGDAMIQHLKSRGKGPGQIMQLVQRQINQKFLPPSLSFEFDMQDDEQDALRADIRDKRSVRHERDLAASILNERVIREQMLADGDISRAQFVQLELADGRLEDGGPVIALFHDPEFSDLLALPGISDPVDIDANEPDTILPLIATAFSNAAKELILASTSNQKKHIEMALAALEGLRELYKEPEMVEEEEDEKVPASDDRDPDHDHEYDPEGANETVERL